ELEDVPAQRVGLRALRSSRLNQSDLLQGQLLRSLFERAGPGRQRRRDLCAARELACQLPALPAALAQSGPPGGQTSTACREGAADACGLALRGLHRRALCGQLFHELLHALLEPTDARGRPGALLLASRQLHGQPLELRSGLAERLFAVRERVLPVRQ